MTVLTDVRDRVRKDLRDTDSSAYRWSDDQLDRHIDHALTELSLALPLETTATLATTAGSREVSLAALDVIEVEAVEYPLGQYPPSYVGFATWATSLMLQVDELPAGADAKLYFTARHVLDGAGTTLSPQQVDLVAMGAGAYAALEQELYAADRITTGERAGDSFGAWGRARLTAFRQLLIQYGRRSRVRTRRLYTPA
jgi:hypothetical protein